MRYFSGVVGGGDDFGGGINFCRVFAFSSICDKTDRQDIAFRGIFV